MLMQMMRCPDCNELSVAIYFRENYRIVICINKNCTWKGRRVDV